jgi:hypothetical protein
MIFTNRIRYTVGTLGTIQEIFVEEICGLPWLIHGQMGTDTKKACQIAVFWIRFHI